MAQSNRDGMESLEASTRALLDIATQDETAESFSFSQKETEILELYDRVFELKLEEALLNHELPEDTQVEDIDVKLAEAERELLEVRARVSVQRKVVESVLMTEPSLQAVHSAPSSPLDRALLRLINKRDILSLAYENMLTTHTTCIRKLSSTEVSNIQNIKQNQELVQSLLKLTNSEKSADEEIPDLELKEELNSLKSENKQKKAQWTRIKRIVSASVAASGVDWASDEKLERLVLDDDEFDDI
ncbi:hypothetical protein H105_01974 [Trichophyton soudanense CBS 452.61]|uniref:Centromere protein H C-terminal domain-containing protein n=1 Tax=Trichophyton soudanense CBS 452.61 TaxID=1215331 RepID=A0A022Y2Q2_TRISD|nr:hypothetical protein H105_01974 [Trichophyton soudanense CBS 452.61]EZG09154.1 hypothetical protein H106_01824 [Trichophyton rubrum CBS 735.88]